MSDSLEVIDITGLSFDDHDRIEKLVADITKSVTTSGFFYLKIEEDFSKDCHRMMEAVKQFYELPRSEILKTVQDSESQFHINGMPIPGTGAGLRPQGRDHSFRNDFRDSFHIGVPIVDESKIDFKAKTYCGAGKTKWPNLDLLPVGWKQVVRLKRFQLSCQVQSQF